VKKLFGVDEFWHSEATKETLVDGSFLSLDTYYFSEEIEYKLLKELKRKRERDEEIAILNLDDRDDYELGSALDALRAFWRGETFSELCK